MKAISTLPASTPPHRMHGFGLIEVLVSVGILAVGILALAMLHVNLIQASADARAASVASNVANETIEDVRSFNALSEYTAIDSTAPVTQTINGMDYQVSQDVTRYRYNPNPDGDATTYDGTFETVGNTDTFTDTQPDFKQITVNVSYRGASGGTKTVSMTDAISSATPQDGLAIARRIDANRLIPQVRIRENTETGVIPIAVGTDDNGNEVASASSNPKPKQYAEGATGTTKFTVDTYLRDQTNPLLQRQLDFAYASCVCKDGGTSTTANPAYEPTYWDGTHYVSPTPVSGRHMGVRDTSVDQDPQLCDTCCRDHHDKLGTEVKADPFRTSTDYTSGDHNHYKTGSTVGSLVLAGSSDSYLESCRMVRVDGIYQVATDTRLENFAMLRLENNAGVANLPSTVSDAYAAFAKTYVENAVKARTSSYPSGGLPNVLFSGGNPTTLEQTYELSASDPYTPHILDVDHDNHWSLAKNATAFLNTRGLYIDWLSPKAIERINCIGNTTDSACAPYKNMELLELVPFVAVNLTQLSMWGSTDTTVATVRNDPIPLVSLKGNNNKPIDFVRGQVNTLADGTSYILASISRSNSGLINTKPIDPQDSSENKYDWEEIASGTAGSSTGPVPFKVIIVNGNSASDKNFSVQNVSTTITSPTQSSPNCAVGISSSTVDQRSCVYDVDGEPLVLTFGNFNYYTCTPLGTKWVYDAVNNQCVLPPANKNDSPQYATPSVRNYQLCSVSFSSGSGVSVGAVTTTDEGLATETASVQVTRAGSQSLKDTLAGISNPTFSATFKTTCP